MRNKNYKLEALNSYSNKTPNVIVMDIGGTYFRSSVFDTKRKLIEKPRRFTTPNFLNYPNLPIKKLQNLLIQEIIKTVQLYRKKYSMLNLNTIGLSFPASVTSEGIALQTCTVWGDRGRNFPLLKNLVDKLSNTRFIIVNDTTAAAERYANLKKYNDKDFICIITISSGLSNKIYDIGKGKVILDKRGIGGEMGHVKLDFSKDAPICDCGGRGHLEAFSSGRAIERLMITSAKMFPEDFKKSYLSKLVHKAEDIRNIHIIESIRKVDKFAIKNLDQAMFWLACSLSHISGSIGIDKFIFVGGFALNLGVPFLESLKRNLLKVDFLNRTKKDILNMVELGINDDNDSLVGIGLLAQKLHLKGVKSIYSL